MQMRYFNDQDSRNWLYRPLPNFKEAIIDSNVIIDAIIIKDGLASFALIELLKRKVKLITSRNSIDEAKAAIALNSNNESKLPDLVDLFIEAAAVDVESRSFNGMRIKKHDQHLTNLITEDSNRYIITEDMPLLYDLNHCKAHGRSLRECAYSLIEGQEPDQKLSIFGTGVGRDGFIFAKFMSSDREFESRRRYYLFYANKLCSMYYVHQKGLYVEVDNANVLEIPLNIKPNQQFSVNLNYSTSEKERLDLRIFEFESGVQRVYSCRVGKIDSPPDGEIVVMNSREKNRGWLGSVQCFTFGPHRLDREVWKACTRVVGLAPPVLTADLIRSAVELTELRDGKIKQPRFYEVVKHMHDCIPDFYPGRTT